MGDGRIDELGRRAGAATPDWNEVREQRVLAAMQRAPRAAPSRRRWPVRAGVAAVAVAAAAAFGLWLSSAPDAAETADAAGRLELADGSRCRLSADARVRVLAQSDHLIRLEQTAGEVEYDVRRRPERAFEVVTDAAVVRVRGTRFTVTVAPETVAVAVSEGRVEVEARDQRTMLSAGDALQVSRGELRATATASSPSLEEPPERGLGGGQPEAPRGSTDDARPGAPPPSLPSGDLRALQGESEPAQSALDPRPSDDVRGGALDPIPSGRPTRRPRPSSVDTASVGTSSVDSVSAAAPSNEAEPSPQPSVETAAALLERADAHRRAGRSTEAVQQLERLLREHPDDPRAASAAFTLGRLERRLGHHARAAASFARSRGAQPAGPLAEDALAEEATAWAAAGEDRRAREAARRYLALHPDGLHAPRMHALAE